uniref:SAM domain-containing protein n=1 Tax=Pan troglodytes TaxID=9598 RepID=A0A2I3T8E7_PANTR
ADKEVLVASTTGRTPSFYCNDGDANEWPHLCGGQFCEDRGCPHILIITRKSHPLDVNISSRLFPVSFCSQDGNLPTLISSVHRSRHLVMPEHQSRCEFQRGSLEIGLRPAGDLQIFLGPPTEEGSPWAAAALAGFSGLSRYPTPPQALWPRKLCTDPAPRKLSASQARASRHPAPFGKSLYHRQLSHRYGFLPHAQAEMFARQQELLRKQNLARLELPADLLRQKELESARPQLLAPETALRPNDGAEELQRRGALLVLNHGAAPLLALPPQGPPGSGPPTPSRDSARRAPRKGGPGPASARPSESKEMTGARLWAQDGSEDEPPKDSDGEDTETAAAGCRGPTPGQAPAGGAGAEGKGLFPGSTLPPPLPLGFPYAVSPYFHTGAVGGLSVDGEEAPAPEDVTKWTVDDVCSFVGGLSGCGEYTRVFREQGIDGETLPLLTEEHLLSTMGLKLGPALKIRAQVARRLGRVFYVASFPVALPLQPPTLRAPERELGTGEQPLSPTTATSPYGGGHALAGRTSPKQENGTLALLPGAPDPSQPLC